MVAAARCASWRSHLLDSRPLSSRRAQRNGTQRFTEVSQSHTEASCLVAIADIALESSRAAAFGGPLDVERAPGKRAAPKHCCRSFSWISLDVPPREARR